MGVAMAQAEGVARYLIWLAYKEPERAPITHLHLQKLLYYMQGWSLAMRGRPIFDEAIEAWKYGPVVPEVYKKFADYKAESFPASEGREGALGPDDAGFVESVWGHYKRYSANELRRMTHSERPWLEARGDCRSDERCQTELGQVSMRSFFVDWFSAHAPEGMGFRELEQAEKDFQAGNTVSLDNLLAEADGRVSHTEQN